MTGEVWLSLDSLIAQREASRLQKRAEDEKAALRKQEDDKKSAAAFEAYQLTPGDKEAIMQKIAKAFAEGEKELMLFAFPHDLCSDGGRRINNSLEEWEATLPGAAARIFEFWRDDLQARGFRFFARVISYPDGMPGEIGVFFSWPKELEE